MVDLNSAYFASFRQNGRRIRAIRDQLVKFTQSHPKLEDIEHEANRLIKQAGGEPAFKKVPGYRWATCISVNDAVVHGIPKGYLEPGDLVTLDLGMFFEGTTTDTATAFTYGHSHTHDAFLKLGRQTLNRTLEAVKPGIPIRTLSQIMQQSIEAQGFNVVRNLTGHGLGATMHEPPAIPCFISGDPGLNQRLVPSQVLAIEVMYMQGDWALKTDPDGWTMRTRDNSLSAVFEDDVLVTHSGHEILT